MNKPSPKLIIFAGANGSGKSTLAPLFLRRVKIKQFINADDMARGISPLDPNSKRIRAGRLVLAMYREMLQKGESFALETTLSGVTLAKILKSAKQHGYHIDMFYMYTSDVKINLGRIEYRVKQGGHNIPSKDVRQRYKRSLSNLVDLYFDLCDTIRIYNNSGAQPEPVAFKIDTDFVVLKEQHEIWKRIKKKSKKLND